MKILLYIFILFLLLPTINCQTCIKYNDEFSSVSIINTFYPVKNNTLLNVGGNSVILDGVPPVDQFGSSFGITPISKGDILLIIQTQGASFNSSNSNLYGSGKSNNGFDNLGGTGYTALNNVGNYEFIIAENDVSLAGGTLQFVGKSSNGGVINFYENKDATNSQGQSRFQVVRIPTFLSFKLSSNLTTTAWNGRVGGILAFFVQKTLDLNNFNINTNGKGFRGGYQNVRPSGGSITDYTSYDEFISSGKGEGICGTPRFLWNGVNQVDNGLSWIGYPGGNNGRGAPGNAGGGGNIHNAGGGGGGGAGFGGVGGIAVGTNLINGGRYGVGISLDGKMFFGGGGGGGDANNATSGVKGGAGGGIIFIKSGSIIGNGEISSSGTDGLPGFYGDAPDGAGGGGGGGNVYLFSDNYTNSNLKITVNGGKGGNTLNDGNSYNMHGPGGGGGGGKIFINANQSQSLVFSVLAGKSGLSNNGYGLNHGASDGKIGIIGSNNTDQILPATVHQSPFVDFKFNNTCENQDVKFEDLSKVQDPNTSQIVKYTWDFGDGTSSQIQNPTHVYQNKGNYVVKLIVETNVGCKDSIIKTVTILEKPNNVFAGNDTIQCNNQVFKLNAISVNSNFQKQWSIKSGDVIFDKPSEYNSLVTLISDTATLVWTVQNEFCSISDEIMLINKIKKINLFKDEKDSISICDTMYQLKINLNATSYSWAGNLSNNTDNHLVDKSGWYLATVNTIDKCMVKDSIFVSLLNAKIQQNDTSICFGNRFDLNLKDIDLGGSKVFYENDFESNRLDNITGGWISNYNNSNVLGKFSTELINWKIADLPAHDSVIFSFDLFIHDSWDGNEPDRWKLMIDNITVYATTFNNHAGGVQSFPDDYPNGNHPSMTGAYQTGLPRACFGGAYVATSLYKMNLKFLHTKDIIDVIFKGDVGSDKCDESWSIDNLKISLVSKPKVKVTWSTGDNTSKINVNPSFGKNNYSVIVEDNFIQCFDSIDITINKIDLDAGNDLTICKEDSVKLNASGGVSYTWDNNVLDGVYFKPDQSRRYVVTGDDGNGCKDTSSLFVKVYPLPSINAGLDTSVCFGTSAELKAKGGISYQWDNGIEDKKPFFPQETKVYKVIGTDVNGCKNFDEVEVKVNPNPEFVLSVTDPCEKQNLAFTVNLGAQTSLVGVKSSSWTGVSSFTSNELNPQILNVGLNQKGSYSITLTDNNNCQTQKSIIANVSPEDQIDFADLGAKCVNDIAFNLPEANIIGGNWSTNDNTSIQDEKQGLFDPSKSKPNSDKKVDVTYSTTTIVPARKCPSQKTKTIIINSLPNIDGGIDTSVCFGTQSVLKAKGGISYQWDNGIEDKKSFIPQETKLYKVIGADVNGCKNSDEVEVKVNPNPEFVLSVTDPCEKQNLAFTVNLGAQTSLVGVKSSSWTGVSSFTSNELNPQILNVGLNQKGSYSITLTDNNNCQTQKSIIANVSPEDQIDFADLGAKCVNDIAFNLPEANIIGGNWSTNDNTSIQDEKQGLFDPSKSKPNSDKKVDVTYSTTTIVPARKCPSQKTKTIIINSLPNIDGGIDTSVCFGTQSVLKAKGGISYQWDNGIEDKKSFIPQETKLYKVIGADVNGCKNSDEVEVKVNPNPEFVLSVTDPCEKQNLAFTVNLGAQTSLVGVKSSSWTGVSSFTSNELNPQILNVGLNQKGSYSITLTDNNNCQTQKSIIANVSPEDQIDFADLGTKCVNDLVFILPAPNIKGGSWSSSDNISIQDKKQGLFDPSKSKPDLDKKIDVTYTTSTVVPVRKCPSHKTKSIFINPIPDSSFYALKQIICEDDEISFRVVNPNVDAIYKWEFGNGESTFKLAPTYTYLNEGNYNVKLTSTLGQCVVTQFKKDYIHVIPKPKNIDFTMSVSEIDFYNPLVYFYTNTQGKYYQWKFGDGSVSDDKNPIHTYPMEPNTYLVTLKVLNMKNHCDLTLTKSILMPEPLIYFIPNSFTPNGDDLNFVFQPIFTYGYDPEQYSFYIYNRWGNLIFETHNTNIGWDGTFANQELTNDTYIWKLEFKEKSNNKKHSKVGHVNLLK